MNTAERLTLKCFKSRNYEREKEADGEKGPNGSPHAMNNHVLIFAGSSFKNPLFKNPVTVGMKKI